MHSNEYNLLESYKSVSYECALFYHELVTNQINLSYLPVSFLLSPVGIAVGSSSGNMYVTDSENNNIQKFAAR